MLKTRRKPYQSKNQTGTVNGESQSKNRTGCQSKKRTGSQFKNRTGASSKNELINNNNIFIKSNIQQQHTLKQHRSTKLQAGEENVVVADEKKEKIPDEHKEKVNKIRQLSLAIFGIKLNYKAAKVLAEYDISYVEEKMRMAKGRKLENISGFLIEACREDWKQKALEGSNGGNRAVVQGQKAKKGKYKDIYIN